MSERDEWYQYDAWKTDSGREGVPESREAIVTPNSAGKLPPPLSHHCADGECRFCRERNGNCQCECHGN